MITAILGLLSVLFGVVTLVEKYANLGSRFLPNRLHSVKKPLGWIALAAGLFIILSRSFVFVGENETGHLNKIYGFSELTDGKIIATDGEKGPQARILPPGFHLEFFIRVIYDIEMKRVVQIEEGQYGLLIAKDGLPLREGQFIADQWQEDEFQKMLQAQYFLTEGGGQKGPQWNVLKPGIHRLNLNLFDVRVMQALDVKTGHVAVIRSNVQTKSDCESAVETAGGEPDSDLSTPIVPKGCVGVWEEPLPPGRYYLNQKAYVPTIIPTRVQTWTYKGGYTRRRVDLSVDENGDIKQKEVTEQVSEPKGAASGAINVRVEGWTVPVEARIVVQVPPKLAAKVVASVGDLQRVEDNIITPSFRDLLRTIGGKPDRKVLDFVENRDVIVQELEAILIPEGLKAGVHIQEVRLGEPALPPEVLVPRLRKQLAQQLTETYEQEKLAQKQRISVEREKATANQQTTLVEAEIKKQAAEFTKQQQKLLGEGEKLRLIEVAKGQQAQANVLGKAETAKLKALEMSLEAASQNPEIVKIPQTQVLNYGGGSTLEGAAAILSTAPGILGRGSTLSQAVPNSQ